MNDTSGGHPPAMDRGRFVTGIEDVGILPLVAIAVVVRKLGRATLSILIHILDYAFPILLQLARFPLFTARILGDGVTAALKGVARFLPMSGTAREEWRQLVSRYWVWLRQKISYKAFEEALHHAFENGMAWVFRTCRTLTPGAALLVLAGAVLWLPISFVVATAMHAVLIAKAASWPAWMQLLHPVATVIAKSKLLVLPAYPAAWPQAKSHWVVQAAFRFYQVVAATYLMQKTGYRYRQAEHAAADANVVLSDAACAVGRSHWSLLLYAGLHGLAGWIRKGSRAAMKGTIQGLSALPLVGVIVRKYVTHYHRADRADRRSQGKLSEKVTDFFERWSIKFSPEYYEAKEASKGTSRAQEGADPPSVVVRHSPVGARPEQRE